MDKNTIVQIVIGGIVTIILTWLGNVNSSVSEAKHERDLMSKDIEYVKLMMEERNESLLKLWNEWDEKNKSEKRENKEELMEEVKFMLEIKKDISEIEVELQKLK